ncbi:hypothetical protein [Sphingomonas sp.]|uniref:hypothetical protein n=1 Tax=Sphingomonas sp. TaxID=28214 RepID=UPI003B3BB55A
MAKIDGSKTIMTTSLAGNAPTVRGVAGPPSGFAFQSPPFQIDAFMTIHGHAGEKVGGWTLGFVQLKYIGTNHARYRGSTVKDGSIFVSSSNRILCRDTDVGSREIWYDSFLAGGMTGPIGSNRLAANAVIPASGALTIQAHLFDQPQRWWEAVRHNRRAGGKPNYLHYAVAELLFCTMLVAQEPSGKRHMLKHVYWNVIWEQVFKRDHANHVLLDRAIRLQHNIQHPVHDGNPHDRKFFGKEYDLTLPVSNVVSNRPPKILEAADWSEG